MALKIILIRGLSLGGDDSMGLGPFRFGHLLGPLTKALVKRGFSPYPLPDLATGDLDHHVSRARQQLQSLEEVKRGQPLHLVGHSLGGVIARALACESSLQVRAVTTIASPHHGSHLAEAAVTFGEQHPYRNLLLKLVRSNAESFEFFRFLTPEAMREWNQNFQNQDGVDYACFRFATKLSEMSPPVRFLVKQMPPEFRERVSDGYVEFESQLWGKDLGLYHMDHMGQIGWNFQINPLKYRKYAKEFQRFVGDLTARLQCF